MNKLIQKLGLIGAFVGSALGFTGESYAQHRPDRDTPAESSRREGREGLRSMNLFLDIVTRDTRSEAQKREDERKVAELSAPRNPVYVIVKNEGKEERKPRIPEHTLLDADGKLQPEKRYTWVKQDDSKNFEVLQVTGRVDIYSCKKWIDGKDGQPKDNRVQVNELEGITTNFKEEDEQTIIIMFNYNVPRIAQVEVIDLDKNESKGKSYFFIPAGYQQIVCPSRKLEHVRSNKSELRITVDGEVYPHRISEEGKLNMYFSTMWFKSEGNRDSGDITDEFGRDDQILVSAGLENILPGELRNKIYNPQGKLIQDKTRRAEVYGSYLIDSGETDNVNKNLENLNAWLVKNGGYGQYRVEWELNGMKIGENKFTIYDKTGEELRGSVKKTPAGK